MKKLKSHFEITRAQQIGISVMILFAGGLFLGLDYFKDHSTHQESKISSGDKKALLELQQQLDSVKRYFPLRKGAPLVKLSSFDPNRLEQKDWESLGFAPNQAMTILKYKKSLGSFSSLDQIKKCFVISDEKFQQLRPYIQLKPFTNLQNLKSSPSSSSKKDLNHVDWEILSKYTGQEKLARRIANYRDVLGGFVSIIQLKEVYGLSETSIEKLAKNFEITDPKSVRKISINQADMNHLKKHPYLRPFAQKIVERREKNGPFKQLEEVKEIMGMVRENFEKVELYLTL